MADDKVSRSKIGRGPTRLKNMFKKINKDDKIPLSIDIHTGVATGQTMVFWYDLKVCIRARDLFFLLIGRNSC